MPALPVRAHPSVGDAVPFVASLALHVGLVAVGIMTFKAVTRVVERTAPPTVTPQALALDDPDRSPLKSLGLPDGDDVRNAQEAFPAPDADGVADRPTARLLAALPGGGAASSADDAIALGAESAFGKSTGGSGIGVGPANGTGDSPGGAALAPFGPRAGRAPGVPFMNTAARANKVVFLCDASGSMMTKFDTLRRELRRAIDPLVPGQQFDVIFFAADRFVALDPGLLHAVPENKRRAFEFLERTAPHDSSDPLPGLRAGFAAGAELIFLLTDGEFANNRQVLEEIRKLNANRRVKINTIAFMDRGDAYEAFLKQVADENGGVYKFVAEEDLRP